MEIGSALCFIHLSLTVSGYRISLGQLHTHCTQPLTKITLHWWRIRFRSLDEAAVKGIKDLGQSTTEGRDKLRSKY